MPALRRQRREKTKRRMNNEKRERRESGGAFDADLRCPAAVPLGAVGPVTFFAIFATFVVQILA
jgi:hypothetical protein